MTDFMTDPSKRRKFYGVVFLVCGLLIGAVGLLIVWSPQSLESAAWKVIATGAIVAAASAVFFVMTFRNDDLVSRHMSKLIAGCTLGMGGLLIAEIWFDVLQDLFFGKIFISLAVFAGLGGFVMAVWDDFFEQKKLKDEGYLD